MHSKSQTRDPKGQMSENYVNKNDDISQIVNVQNQKSQESINITKNLNVLLETDR